jgi:hypothetical protein
MGAALTGCRTLAQAISANEIAVGDINVPFIVDDGAGNWQSAFFTITSTTVITCTKIINSSNNGNAVNFIAGTPTVFNSAPAALLNMGLINPYDPGFDIILLLGQSNMVGMDVNTPLLDLADSRVYMFGSYPNDATTYQKITQAVDPLRHYFAQVSLPTMGNGAGLGPGSWLGRTYAGMCPSNRKVLLVPAARSATKLFADTREWFPGDGTAGSGVALGATGSVLLDNAINQATLAVTAAQKIYPASRVVGIAWHQGEGDADYYGSNLQLNYTGAMKTLIQAIRTRVPTASNAWFVIGGLVAENVADTSGHPGYQSVDNAHRTVAAEFPRCAYTPGLSGYMMGDNLHYNAAGARLLGSNMASVIPQAMLSQGVDTTAPVTRAAIVYASDASTIAWSVSEPVDPNYVPAASAFTLTGHTATGVRVQGNYIYVSVTPAFVYGEAARTLTYTAPGTNGLRDLAGNQMVSTTQSIGNNVPSTATATTLTGPTTGTAGVASSNFTVGVSPVGSNITGTVVVTPSDGGAGGTFSPTSVSLTTASPTATFTYTAAAAGTITISTTNNGSLTNPTSITFTASAASSETLSINTIATQTVGTPFTVSGTWTTVQPANLDYRLSDDTAGVWTQIAATINANGTWSFSLTPSTSSAGRTLSVRDRVNTGVTATSNTYVVNASSSGTQDIRFNGATLQRMTETSSVAPYSYQTAAGVGYDNSPLGGVTGLGLSGDGTIRVKIAQLNSGNTKPMIGFKTTKTIDGYGYNSGNMMAGTAGYGMYYGSGSTLVSNRVPAENDWMEFRRTGSTIQAYVSSDNAQTWTQILQFTGVPTGTLYFQIQSQSGGQFIAPSGTGTWV